MKVSFVFVVSVFFTAVSLLLSPMSARAAVALPANEADLSLVRDLAAQLVRCVEQPVAVNPRSGNPSMGAIRSHCDSVIVADDRVELMLHGRSFTLLIKDNELADESDINDLYVQYDSREDQEVLVAKGVLAYGDPVLAALAVSGHRAEELPQVAEDASTR